MTPCDVAKGGPGQLVLTLPNETAGGASKQISIRFDPKELSPRVETIELKDNQLKRVWGSTLRRVLLTAIEHEQVGTFEISVNRLRD